MGLISAALNAAGGTLASQWKEYFYVDSLPDNVLATKAQKKVRGRFGGSRHEDDNVISDGSVIAVADGYDYYYVPTFYVDGVKVHEGGIYPDEVEAILRKAMK